MANILAAHATHFGRYDKAIKQYIVARNHNEVHGLLINHLAPDYVVKYRGKMLYRKLKEEFIDAITQVEYTYKMTAWTEYTSIYADYC